MYNDNPNLLLNVFPQVWQRCVSESPWCSSLLDILALEKEDVAVSVTAVSLLICLLKLLLSAVE
jgi:hypothetical protein